MISNRMSFQRDFPGELTFFPRSSDVDVALIAQEVQQDLANIGIKVKLLELSFATYMDKIISGPEEVPEMGWTEWYADYVSPDDFVVPFANPDFPPVGWNPAYYSNSGVSELFQKAPYTVDANERAAMYKQITMIMYEDAPYAWLGQFTGYYVYRSNVHGIYNHVILSGAGGLDYSTIYLTAT